VSPQARLTADDVKLRWAEGVVRGKLGQYARASVILERVAEDLAALGMVGDLPDLHRDLLAVWEAGSMYPRRRQQLGQQLEQS
jgi:hypothetical protein